MSRAALIRSSERLAETRVDRFEVDRGRVSRRERGWRRQFRDVVDTFTRGVRNSRAGERGSLWSPRLFVLHTCGT